VQRRRLRCVLLSLFLNRQNILFDVGRSMFDTRHMKLAKDKVSFKIRLAAFQASGGADT
jgi:hypothetical protein